MFMVDCFYNNARKYILKRIFLKSDLMTESLVPKISVKFVI